MAGEGRVGSCPLEPGCRGFEDDAVGGGDAGCRGMVGCCCCCCRRPARPLQFCQNYHLKFETRPSGMPVQYTYLFQARGRIIGKCQQDLPNAIRKLQQTLMNGLPHLISDKMTKTIVLQRMDTRQLTFIEADLQCQDQEANLRDIFDHYCPLQTHMVEIYDPCANAFLPLSRIGDSMAQRLIEPTFILVRFRPKPLSAHPRGTPREDRSKERTIGQVIELVRRWRALHETRRDHPERGRKKLSLPQAAQMVGVSKKSLDDYYCQLRIAEMHGFDFEAHMQEGVGVLRTFVKQKRQGKQPKKHPKILRLIEDIAFSATIQPPLSTVDHYEGMQQHNSKSNKQEIGTSPKQCKAHPQQLIHQETDQQKLISELQYEYYRGFEYLLDEPVDPFITLNRNFSVRLFDDDHSNSIHFY